jgi:hypothetical protein
VMCSERSSTDQCWRLLHVQCTPVVVYSEINSTSLCWRLFHVYCIEVVCSLNVVVLIGIGVYNLCRSLNVAVLISVGDCSMCSVNKL